MKMCRVCFSHKLAQSAAFNAREVVVERVSFTVIPEYPEESSICEKCGLLVEDKFLLNVEAFKSEFDQDRSTQEKLLYLEPVPAPAVLTGHYVTH